MIVKRLCAEHYDELLDVLNRTFTRQNKREMDFLTELPRMWVRSDEYMGKHIGVFEDGKLCAVMGIYPLPVKICGISLQFATTGNVATLPEYEGRGYFSALFTFAMRELENGGYDAARLGGQRQRYERFGYEDCGQLFEFVFTEANRKKCFGNYAEGVDLIPLQEQDTEALAFARTLANSKLFYVERYGNDKERDVFRCMHAKNSKAYMAFCNGKWIGYVCASSSGKVHELRAVTTDDFMKIVCRWQEYMGTPIAISIAPHMTEEMKRLFACAQDVTITAPYMFRIVQWERVCDALMKLANATRKLPEGERYLRIEGCGIYRFFVNRETAGCEKTDRAEYDFSIEQKKAGRLLFGPCDPVWMGDIPLLLHAWFPLPLTWNFMDYV